MCLYNSIMFILHIQRPIKCIQRGLVAKFNMILRKKNCNCTIYLELIFANGRRLVFGLIFSSEIKCKQFVHKSSSKRYDANQYHVKHRPTHLRLWIILSECQKFPNYMLCASHNHVPPTPVRAQDSMSLLDPFSSRVVFIQLMVRGHW